MRDIIQLDMRKYEHKDEYLEADLESGVEAVRTYASGPRPKRKVKPTPLQIRAAREIIRGAPSVGAAMRRAGYSESCSLVPHKLTKSPGFRQIADNLGLTDDFIAECLKEDIVRKPQNRKPELELAAKMRGLLREKMDIDLTAKSYSWGDPSDGKEGTE